MGEIAAATQTCFTAISRGTSNFSCKLKAKRWQEPTSIPEVRLKSRLPSASSSTSPSSDGRDPQPSDTVTYSANVATDTPFHEPPGVSFAEYLKDRPRIFRAMFPDTQTSQRLNEEEWRIQMLPVRFMRKSVSPVVVMRLRCKSDGQGYHPIVPLHVERVLELEATRWELQGLDAETMPSNFSLSVQGLLYSERNSSSQEAQLKGSLELSISLVLPSLLALVPKNILRATAELVLRRLVETMKQEVNQGLLADFQSFGQESLMKQGEVAEVVTDSRGDHHQSIENQQSDGNTISGL